MTTPDSHPVTFDRALWGRLVETWQRLGAPAGRPGALVAPESPARRAQRCSAAGVVLPPEVELWWSLHDGTRFVTGEGGSGLTDSRDVFSLADSLETEITDHEATPVDHMLPIASGWPQWCFDIRDTTAPATPIRIYDPHDPPTLRTPPAPYDRMITPSLGELVLIWIDNYERGLWGGRDDGDFDAVESIITEDDRRRGVY